MTCAEFRKVLPEIMDRAPDPAQDAHLRICPGCSSLVSDLNSISQEARLLRASEEPSPRVWNSIEIALRQEGLIHTPKAGLSLVTPAPRRWSMVWLAPLAAALVLTVALSTRYLKPAPTQSANQVVTVAPAQVAMNSDDEQLLQAVGKRSPAMRATYEANLKSVNAYIRDAEESAQLHPEDEDAQQSVMDAYEQKNMVYEMAYDRSLR